MMTKDEIAERINDVAFELSLADCKADAIKAAQDLRSLVDQCYRLAETLAEKPAKR